MQSPVPEPTTHQRALRPRLSRAPVPPGDEVSRAPERWALAGLSLSMLLSSLGTSSANVALPTLARVFAAPFQSVQWIVLAYLLAITTVVVSVGRLGDLVGRRRLLLAGIGVFTAASVLGAAAPSLTVLIAARAIQGLGAAVMLALTLAFVGQTVPAARSGAAMGLLGTMSAIGTALGPSLGGVLISLLSWRAIFGLNVPLGVLALVLAHRFLPADEREALPDRVTFDARGTVLLALALGAYAMAMTTGHGRVGPLNVALLAAAVVGAGLFLRAERRAQAPLVRLTMFRDPALSGSLAMSALVATVMMATLVVGPFYLARTLGLGPALVGLVLSVGPLVTALTGVPAGRVVDRIGAQRVMTAGLAAMVTAALALSLTSSSAGVPGYVLPLVLLTAGYAVFQTANNTAVMSQVRADQRGVTSGLLSLSRNLGLLTGASVMGAVFAIGSGSADVATALPGAVAVGLRLTFAVATLLVVAALAVALRSAPRSRRAGPVRG